MLKEKALRRVLSFALVFVLVVAQLSLGDGCASVAQASDGNLLSNGDFSKYNEGWNYNVLSGDSSGWDCTAKDIDGDSSNQYFNYWFGGSEGAFILTQDITLQPGSYELKANITCDGGIIANVILDDTKIGRAHV